MNVKKAQCLLNVSVMEACGSAEMEDALNDTEFVMEQIIARMGAMRVD